MSEENKALARRILEDLVVALNLDNLDEYFADDVVVHVPFLDLPPGREGLRMLSCNEMDRGSNFASR